MENGYKFGQKNLCSDLFGRFRTHVSILVVIYVLCFWQNLTNFFSSAFDIGANVVKTKSNNNDKLSKDTTNS